MSDEILAALRDVAAKHLVDHRTLRKALEGQPVKGIAVRQRVSAALADLKPIISRINSLEFMRESSERAMVSNGDSLTFWDKRSRTE